MTREKKLLLILLEEAFEKHAWHGPNLRGSIRGVTEAEAAWRPGRGRHNIWEIVVHAAYWKYAVRRRLTGGKRGSFLLKGSNWFTSPDPSGARTWRGDVALLEKEHRALRRAISGFPESALHRKNNRSRLENIRLAYGVANHDVYHAGQIQILKRLCRSHAR